MLCICYVLCVSEVSFICHLQLKTFFSMNKTPCVYNTQHTLTLLLIDLWNSWSTTKLPTCTFFTPCSFDKHTLLQPMLLNCSILATTMLKDLMHVFVYVFSVSGVVTTCNALCYFSLCKNSQDESVSCWTQCSALTQFPLVIQLTSQSISSICSPSSSSFPKRKKIFEYMLRSHSYLTHRASEWECAIDFYWFYIMQLNYNFTIH